MEDKPMEARVGNLETRMQKVEDSVVSITGKMNDIDKTVRDEGREQRDLLNRLLDHSLGMAKQKENNKTKIIVASLGAIGGTGGIIALILQFV